MLGYVSRYFNTIAPLLRRIVRKRYGYELAAKAYNGARPIYRQMLADFPSIGADNPMANNAYESLVFFAMYRAAAGELTPDMLRAVVDDLFDLPVVKGAIGLSRDLNRASGWRARPYGGPAVRGCRVDRVGPCGRGCTRGLGGSPNDISPLQQERTAPSHSGSSVLSLVR